MTDLPPGAVQLDVRMLFQMIGELYAENWMRKANANQSVSGDVKGNGGFTTPTTDTALFNGNLPEKISRQTGSR